jgi:hypothetical protein
MEKEPASFWSGLHPVYAGGVACAEDNAAQTARSTLVQKVDEPARDHR